MVNDAKSFDVKVDVESGGFQTNKDPDVTMTPKQTSFTIPGEKIMPQEPDQQTRKGTI